MIKPKVIAEIGTVHLGSVQRAKELIGLARICDADYVKFQKRNPDECVPESIKHKPHPNLDFAYGSTYLEHRKNLELSISQHIELFDYCKKIGIEYSASVWDMTSAREIVTLNPEFIKIPSPCNNNRDIIEYLIDNYDGDIHLSTGMTSHKELNDLIEYIKPNASKFVIYHCTSIYPCSFEKLYLLDIKKLNALKCGYRVGFSNHGYGIAADIAAYLLGAEYIERHFVDDRALKHSDAAASLEPDGLRKLCRDLKNVERALNYSPPEIDEKEVEQKNKLRKY